MATITLKGNTIHTSGEPPRIGEKIKDFELVNTDLERKTLHDFTDKYLVLNIFPSVGTGICATSVRTFNKEAAALNDTKVLCISRDLPFAQKQFCGAEGIDNVVMLSDFDTAAFGKDYNLLLLDGPMKGLLSRVVIIVNENREVIYTEQVPEIAQEPNYEAALAVLK